MDDDDLTHLTPQKEWWPRFFDKFRETGIVKTACRAAKISKQTVYLYRRTVPEFAAQWAAAEQEALGLLEDVATQRATVGKSDTMLIFLLKTRGREKYGDKIEQQHSGAITVKTMSLDDADADELKRRLADAAQALLPGGPDTLRET